jgi:hypothetical protein
MKKSKKAEAPAKKLDRLASELGTTIKGMTAEESSGMPRGTKRKQRGKEISEVRAFPETQDQGD